MVGSMMGLRGFDDDVVVGWWSYEGTLLGVGNCRCCNCRGDVTFFYI